MLHADLPESRHFENRMAWRQWLGINGSTEKNVWLRIYKNASSIPSVSYDEAVDEALCFGWIDSSVKKGDADFYLQYFAQRNPKSNWSRVNKAKVEKLTQAGLMTEAGQRLIDLAQKTGTWTALDEVENLITPPDLEVALNANPTAKLYFESLSRSTKRAFLEQLLLAKQPLTRAKRIALIVGLSAK